MVEFLKEVPSIRFMALRRWWYAISAIVVVASIVLVMVRGLNLTVDFTGGVVFGYVNVDVPGPTGERSHVVRRIDEAQAAIVREIFELYASGLGVRGIAKQLNEAGRDCPRAQQGRPKGWAPSSVWGNG